MKWGSRVVGVGLACLGLLLSSVAPERAITTVADRMKALLAS